MKLDEVFQKVIFLIGAGASADAHCKLSKEMLFSLEIAINNISPSDDEWKYRDDFQEIFHFILASLNYQIVLKDISSPSNSFLNIEDFVMILRQLIDKEFIIPYPLIGNWNDKIIKWEMKNGDVFNRFKDFITFQLINQWTKFEKSKAKEMLNPLRSLLVNPDDFCLRIFSLNYDLIFEEVFNTKKLKLLDDGFSERTTPSGKIQYWAKEFNSKDSNTKINLYKLHGSLNWVYNLSSEDISKKESVFDGREPLIIFGSYSKMLSFDPFLYILSTFRDLLEEATILITIGYSFHDKYINNLIIQQLSQNTQYDIPKKLIVVDPSWKGKSERDFSEELRKTQNNKSLNDVINFSHLSPERIELIPKTAKSFFQEYFSNSAAKIIDELNQMETGAKPF